MGSGLLRYSFNLSVDHDVSPFPSSTKVGKACDNRQARFPHSFNLPGLLMAPPYLFSSGGVGLMQIAAIIGFTVALLLGGWLSDVITAREIIKAGGRVTPEQRLISLIPFVWVTPVACILNGLAASRQWSWVAVAFIFGMRE